ncbi:hypothetical protein ACIQU4_03820 [Streptomyces sp. NPDC090741]|uniref:hypothetical protein n=1 Tax=Streptomyces sp. NPDC090741 TaxID=3365967 RepID=UPI0038239CE8
MAGIKPGVGAALSVTLSAATGYVTNMVTDEWNWSLGIALGVFVAAAAALAWWDRAHTDTGPRRTTVRQTAEGGSTITGGAITARLGSDVTENAVNRGTIRNSTIEAGNAAQVERKADDSRIEDNQIVTD